MTYAYDDWVQMPTKDLYDTAIMKMAIDAAKDMYDKSQGQMENFYKTYGDFMSPFAKDMEAYGTAMNNVRSVINDAYSRGIDLFKSPEGRMLMQQLSHSIDPRWYNTAKQNAKVGYAYLDAIQDLRKKGKYSEAQELFDILHNKGTLFQDFSTLDENNNLQMWNRPSPVEATSLLDLTYDFYKNRTPKDLTKAEVESIPGYTYDPKYQYTGYLDPDILAVAPGAAAALQADPRFAYFVDQARQQALLRNPDATQADIDAQLYRNIADANQWALVNPTKKADEFALDDYRTKNDDWLDRRRQSRQHYYHDLENNNDGDGTTSSGWNVAEDVYVTSLAKGAGWEHLPNGGVGPLDLNQMLKLATKRQNAAVRNTEDVLSATGMFIAPEKMSGLIQSDQKNGRGFFLNSAYFKNLHEIDDIRSSYKGWLKKGSTVQQSKDERAKRKQASKDIVSGIRDWDKTDKKHEGYRLKVVPVPDDNGNNVYGMVGDDGKWHTYARVRVYMSNGSKTMDAGSRKNGRKSDIPVEGREMLLDVGLHSNEGTGTPDYSITALEDLGFYGNDYTVKKVGRALSTAFPYAKNTIK